MTYICADSLEDVLERLAVAPWPRVVCGATDLFAGTSAVTGKSGLLDISRVATLRGIERRGNTVRIGAATTWDALAAADSLPTALRQAAAQIGPRQIRVQASIGGNLCHASPVADGVPPLLALDAQVELASKRGVRRLPLAQFMVGRSRTALQPGELLTAVAFELPHARDRTAFIKCTNRDGPSIAVVSAAVLLSISMRGVIEKLAISVGGASEAPLRIHALEAALQGQHLAARAPAIAAASLSDLLLIDDCRAPAAHRIHAARLAIAQAFDHCMEESSDGLSPD